MGATLKKLLGSKILRFGLSGILVFLAFRKIDLKELFAQLGTVPIWFVALNVLIYAGVTVLGSYRWSLLLIKSPKWKDVINFSKASYLGTFYSLVFPTAFAGDLLKWTSLQKSYPEMAKATLLSSSLIDRVVGFTTFITVAFFSSLLGIFLNFQFPRVLMILFGGLFVSVWVFYLLVFSFDFGKYIRMAKIKYLARASEIVDLLRRTDKKQLIKCLMVSMICEFAWITPVWLTGLIFHAGMSLVSVYIFVPVIALILVLPISVAGFGARENLYLIFFSQLGIPDAKILVVSAFVGIITVVNALLGGLWLLF